jgi:hypothetical protein
VLARRPNLLVLDEPTNDLDLDALQSLEAYLDRDDGAFRRPRRGEDGYSSLLSHQILM